MELNFEGVVVGVMSLVIIGAFHPLVIWFEYHFTQSIWPVFLIAGLLCLIAALFIQGLFSVLLGLLGVAGGLPISILLTECVWFYIIIPRLAMTNREVHPIMQAKL